MLIRAQHVLKPNKMEGKCTIQKKIILLVICLVVLILFSCQNKNVVSNINGLKANYSVDPELITYFEDLHTHAVTEMLTNEYIMEIVDNKRANNETYFTDEEVKKRNEAMLDIAANYLQYQQDLDAYAEILDEINDASFNLDDGKYYIEHPDNLAEIYRAVGGRDYDDPVLGPIYAELDKCIAEFGDNFDSKGYEDALEILNANLAYMASCSYPTEECAEIIAQMIGIARSSAILIPDYITAFGRYSSNSIPLRNHVVGFILADQVFDIVYPFHGGLGALGNGTCSATYLVCWYIHVHW